MSRVTITPPPEQGTGTVTSVGLTMPAGFSVANSPVTGSGTLVGTLSTLDASKISGGTFATTEAIFTTDSAAKVPVTIRGFAAQSANLLTFQDSTPTTVAVITKAGHIGVGASSPANASFRTVEAFTDIAAASQGFAANITLAITVANAQNLIGVLAAPVANHATFNYTGSLIGVLAQATMQGTSGTASLVVGLDSLVSSTTGGTLTAATGIRIRSITKSGGGTIGTAVGLDILPITVGSTNFALRTQDGAGDWNSGGGALADFRFRSDNDAANGYHDSVNDRWGHGTATPDTKLHAFITDAATATITDVFKITHDSSGTPAANFGTGILVAGESSTTSNTLMGRLSWIWATATHASRKAEGQLSAYDTAERIAVRWGTDGANPTFAVLGGAPIARQVGPAATAGALYTATEQAMLQTVYDVVRAFNFMN